jgi:hypothetical protein
MAALPVRRRSGSAGWPRVIWLEPLGIRRAGPVVTRSVIPAASNTGHARSRANASAWERPS